jgi:hypothetical protein
MTISPPPQSRPRRPRTRRALAAGTAGLIIAALTTLAPALPAAGTVCQPDSRPFQQ